jgi:predicted unusual protein kinase regulating ubiquinone biosynthesis (AarF/ABC1/UbiB family)
MVTPASLPSLRSADGPQALEHLTVEMVLEDMLPEGDLRSAALPNASLPNGALGEGLRYDPEAIESHYSQHPLLVAKRTAQIFGPLSKLAISFWRHRRSKDEALLRRQAIQLREVLTKLGPAFIKIGQALSTRPDLVPPVYMEELTKLQDQLPAFDNAIAFQFIQEELGNTPQEIYAEISDKPVAAASLGQVYKAKLKTGETVAVKVQRPGLAQNIALDIYILRSLSRTAMRQVKQIRSDLVGIIDEFAGRIFEEMDYTQEGRNAERFGQLYGHLPDIYIPKIYWPYTGRRVLTMEWITGIKLTQLEAIKAQGLDPTYIINIGVQCSLRQLLEHGFFHADPHPGNLLAMPNGKLAYLDFGMMSEMKPYQRYGLIEAIVHLVNRDFEGLAHDYVKLDFLSPETDLTPIIPAFAAVFGNALGASVAEINIKSIADQLSELMYEYPFQVPAYFALIIRSLVTLEGIAISVDPEFKVLSEAYPYVAKRLLTDPAPELRNSLKELLFKDDSFRWNRLENLLTNAKNSWEYDLGSSLDQGLEYLFSERGELIRDQVVQGVVRGLDTLGSTTFNRLGAMVGDRLGIAVPGTAPVNVEDQKTLEHLQRIFAILGQTQGVDPAKLLPVIPQLLFNPEVQRMGQQIASQLAQRTFARILRELLLSQETPQGNNSSSPTHNQFLPPHPPLR